METMLVMPLLCLLLVVVLRFALLCIEGQLVEYAVFMASRSYRVMGDVVSEVKRIAPWMHVTIDSESQTLYVRGRPSLFSAGLQKSLIVTPHPQTHTNAEDNPICSAGGDAC